MNLDKDILEWCGFTYEDYDDTWVNPGGKRCAGLRLDMPFFINYVWDKIDCPIISKTGCYLGHKGRYAVSHNPVPEEAWREALKELIKELMK